MIKLDRLGEETYEIEKKLEGPFAEIHQQIRLNPGSFLFPGSKRVRWLSAKILLQEQTLGGGGASGYLPEARGARGELEEQVRAIQSDYGTLCLEGVRLFLGLMTLWILSQTLWSLRLSMPTLYGVFLGCTVFYPVAVYTFWNRLRMHPFKTLKLILGGFGVFAAWGGLFLLSLMDRRNPFLAGYIAPGFNLTEFLILMNMGVLVSFIIFYRQANQFSEISLNSKEKLVSFSGLDAKAQSEIIETLKGLELIPLKTQTRLRLKERILKAYAEAGSVEESLVRSFIRTNCIDMNWVYWSGSIVQWSILIMLLSKLIWAMDTGLMVSADYFRQKVTTGAVLGALAMSLGVFCPLNRYFRELLYHDGVLTIGKIWRLGGLAILSVSIPVLSGLTPSRFIWGDPVNPAPHFWGFVVLITLVLSLQFLKSDTRLQDGNT